MNSKADTTALERSKMFDKFWRVGLPGELMGCGVSGRKFYLIQLFFIKSRNAYPHERPLF